MVLPILLTVMAAKTMYIGTYTDPQGSKGIYRVELDQQTGALSEAKLVAETQAPSYLTIHPNGKFLYAVNEYSDGEATAFSIEAEGLKKVNSLKFDGRGPCHISIDQTKKWLYVSAYGGGTLNVLSIKDDGSLGENSGFFKNEGTGPNKGRQEAPHMHFAAAVDGFVYACDLGTDEVLSFRQVAGKLQPLSPKAGKTEPGTGPRHFVLHPNKKTLYVNNEMTLGVSVFDRDLGSGTLKHAQTISTLNDGEPTERRSTAAIRVHPNLPILYVSNRGHNSIAIFDILPSGQLKRKQVHMLAVKEPRDFAIDPSGTWMIVGGQNSGELVSLRIDPKSGELSPTQYRTAVSKPVCIAFSP